MEITVKESMMVRSSEETPKKSLWISNIDLVMERYHIPTIYFYNTNGSSNFMDPRILKEGLSKILVCFYPIAGRLGYAENGRLEILCNGEGTLFIEAEASSSMEHLVGNCSDNSDVMRLIWKADYSQGISSFPLFVAQVSRKTPLKMLDKGFLMLFAALAYASALTSTGTSNSLRVQNTVGVSMATSTTAIAHKRNNFFPFSIFFRCILLGLISYV